jgi:hypothetical protein
MHWAGAEYTRSKRRRIELCIGRASYLLNQISLPHFLLSRHPLVR